jgi:hypothetical protein
MSKLTFADINARDMVDFLAGIGYHPKKIIGRNYWYCSPLREERTASFVVDRARNRWKDFGTGEGSTLIDFCILYYKCTIRELIEKFSRPEDGLQSVPHHAPKTQHVPENRIEILGVNPIISFYLVRYFWERRILIDVAEKYCVEVKYKVGEKAYSAIGFANDKGGYELRNKYFKGGSYPKAPTFIETGSSEIAVFEGFFDALTFLSFVNCPDEELPNLLVLNSLVFFRSCMPVMDRYSRQHLFLDNDAAGDECTAMVTGKSSTYQDHRSLYKSHKDLNLWVCSIGKIVSRRQMKGRNRQDRAQRSAPDQRLYDGQSQTSKHQHHTPTTEAMLTTIRSKGRSTVSRFPGQMYKCDTVTFDLAGRPHRGTPGRVSLPPKSAGMHTHYARPWPVEIQTPYK